MRNGMSMVSGRYGQPYGDDLDAWFARDDESYVDLREHVEDGDLLRQIRVHGSITPLTEVRAV